MAGCKITKKGMVRKYDLTNDSIKVNGIKLYRIVALRDIRYVKAGDIGGYIQDDCNLSHNGSAWVAGDARVYGGAWISGGGLVYQRATVHDEAWVSGDSRIFGNAVIRGGAIVYGQSRISGATRAHGGVLYNITSSL